MGIFDIEDLLETFAQEGRVRFSPHYVCQRLNVNNVEEVTSHLLSLANKKVITYYEVECPNGDTDIVISDPSKLDVDTRTCRICGEEYQPDPERIWISFELAPSFIGHVKKKSSKLKKTSPKSKLILV